MLTAEDHVQRYMRKLKSGSFKKVDQPNNGEPITREYINKSVDDFGKVLDSEIYKKIVG